MSTSIDRHWIDILKAMGHETRLKIVIELLEEGTKCVTDINELLPSSQANISQHLSVLRNAGIVDYTQDGAQRCYYVCRPGLIEGIVNTLRNELSEGAERKTQCCLRNADSTAS